MGASPESFQCYVAQARSLFSFVYRSVKLSGTLEIRLRLSDLKI